MAFLVKKSFYAAQTVIKREGFIYGHGSKLPKRDSGGRVSLESIFFEELPLSKSLIGSKIETLMSFSLPIMRVVYRT